MIGWWSQPFPPEGSVASDGILKQLGLPTLEPLEVMLRETAQNAWDARLVEQGPIRLTYRVETLGERRAEAFVARLLPGPSGDRQLETLASHLTPDSPILVVSDRLTSGLGGPIRSDEPRTSESPDFVNFVRNAGEPRDRHLGGGTFGFGKGALFRVSHPGVLLIDTVCDFRGRRQRRLIGAALGHSHERRDRRFTGRHWWGDTSTGIPDPLLDSEADSIGAELDLIGFDDETGTDIYVIGADLGELPDGEPRSTLAAAELLAGAAAWNLWPKLIERGGSRAIHLEIRHGDAVVPMPDPERSTRLRCFVEALRKIDSGLGTPHTRSTKPVNLGQFAVCTDVWIERREQFLDAAQPFEGKARHCARMRHVELIVDYFPGDPPVDPAVQYGAVYRASEEADEYFAQAEPPTHHDWITQHLVSTAKGVVTAARRFIRDQMHAVAEPLAPTTSGSTAPLGRLSSALARILPTATGDGASESAGGRGVGGGRRTSRVKPVGEPVLTVRDRTPVIMQRVRFEPSNVALTATVSAHVGVDGGREKSAPVGAPAPTVIGWQPHGGSEIRPGTDISLAAADPRDWIVLVRPAADATTIVQVAEVMG